MALTLNAEQKSIYDIFSGENQYIIPPYQRAYSWTNVQCKALFEDIKKAFYDSEQEGYFLGNIVLAKSREERNKLEVIDGQQRLTSLTLLLKVLLSFDTKNKALHNAIWIEDRRTEEEIQRLETNVFMEKDFNYFKEVLALDFSNNICESLSKEDNLFKQNICYFYLELKEFSKKNDILKFSDFLLDNIYILPIETEDSNADKAREKALQIFETINNRGLNLSTSDIFKARLYSMALNELAHKDFIEKWKDLTKRCEKINYRIDAIFKIYTYTIRGKERIKTPEIPLRDFFIKDEKSPFNKLSYIEILNDLFKIVDAIQFYQIVFISPKKYNDITKWFQILNSIETYPIKHFGFDILIVFLYKNGIKNYDKIINFSKDIVRTLMEEEFEKSLNLYDDIFINVMADRFKYKCKRALTNISGGTLLKFYLNSKLDAVYPYYIENIFDIKDDSFDIYEYMREEEFYILFFNSNQVILEFPLEENITLFEKIELFKKSKIHEVQEIGKELAILFENSLENEKEKQIIFLKNRNIFIEKRFKNFFCDK